MPCAPPTKTGYRRLDESRRRPDRQVRCSRQQRSAGHLSPIARAPSKRGPAATAASTPAATSYLPTGSSEHHRYVGRPDRGHRGTARWPPAPVERPGDPVTVRPDRRKHTRSLAHRADGHLRPIVGPGTEHVPAARVVHPPKLDIARQMPGTHRSGPRPVTVYHSRSVPIRMQAEQCGRVNASANGRGGAPGPLPHRCRAGAFACKKRATARRCRTTGGRAVPSAPTPVP